MEIKQWFENFPGAITLTDENAIITAMNKQSGDTFKSYGGRYLIGQDLRDCHPPSSQEKIRSLYEDGKLNAYTIEKDGKKKLIYQTPVYEDGELIGVVELSLPLPTDMPHFVRD